VRRFRRSTAFRLVSQRERRNADLFFADLVGARTRLAPAPGQNAHLFFEELLFGAARTPTVLPPSRELPQDFPAAEAESPPDTAPAPTVTAGADADEIIITRGDGTTFHVRRKVRAKVFTRPGRPRVGFCSDDERVFFRVAWCEGTQGRIDLGANPQAAFKDLIDKVFTQINKGADPDKIKETFENASVQTFLDLDITKVNSWKITGDVKLDINRTGITSASARLSADRGWIKLGAEYKRGPDDQQVLVTVEIPLEKRKISGKVCPVRELIVWWDVECMREVPTTITLTPGIDPIEKKEQLYLYFDHAKTTLRRDPKGAAATPSDEVEAILRSEPKIGTARLNKRMLERLDYLVGQGYWLISVDGYASPEGRRPGPKPTDRGLMAKWEGNEALSRERAQKVLDVIKGRYGSLMRLRSGPGTPPAMVFPPDQRWPTGVGHSEVPKLDDRLGRELEGPALDRAVINGDPTRNVEPFLKKYPQELTRMTDEDRQFVADTSKSVRNRAERLFENLRRVEIRLLHREPVKDVKLATYYLKHEPACPKDLIEAAERKWGSRIPFIKRDPPICNPD
jgi:hypothetical protein